MAIGNYTSFLRSPDRGGARSKGGVPTKQDLDAMHRRLRERQQTEDDMRQERLQKFADSLMKQRNLRKMTATKQAGTGGAMAAAAATGQQQKRSRSKESKKSTPDSSPSRRSERPSRRRSKSSSAVKSHSLTDLKDAATGETATDLRAYMSNSELAHAQLLPDFQARQQPAAYGSALLQRIFAGSSEPSSVSSAATVVATADAAVGVDEEYLDHFRSVGTDPQSIPQHLQVRH